jgi:hypothetical protein
MSASSLACWAPIARQPGSESGPPTAGTLEFVRALVTVVHVHNQVLMRGRKIQPNNIPVAITRGPRLDSASLQTQVPPLNRPASAMNSSAT